MKRIIKSCFVLAGESESRFTLSNDLIAEMRVTFGSVSVSEPRFAIQSMRFGCTDARDAISGQNETEVRVDFSARVNNFRDRRRSAKTSSLDLKSITLLIRLLRLAALINRCDIGQINLIIVKYHAQHTRT